MSYVRFERGFFCFMIFRIFRKFVLVLVLVLLRIRGMEILFGLWECRISCVRKSIKYWLNRGDMKEGFFLI